jgi:hypothetical protein
VDVINQTTGAKVQYLLDFVIAADGGRTFGPALGIELAGPSNVGDVTPIHVRADLLKYWEEDTTMYRLVNVGGQKDALGPRLFSMESGPLSFRWAQRGDQNAKNLVCISVWLRFIHE